ncbi:NADP-dependent alcohol dehydrogenase C [Ampelomyces quisqualis]|uniref:alcohol dehydrogenase (NADP(+)) n=1 Tax=Ampelomyces quisqualis TaxID=50730 RepID=A0A6A5R1R0_AMPQU|nr:NADP-dependent alcohol dehydrogenase C [Ampelomyces quisqualis]
MPYPKTTDAFTVTSTKSWSNFTRQEVPLKKFEEDDIDIAVDACGVCASDIHTITGGWGEIPLPLCVGHEIIGRAIRIGSKVQGIALGDRIGVGAQVAADLACNNCKADQENYCPNQKETYGAQYDDGTITQGGFSSHVRVHQHFAFKIPDTIDSAVAGPMMCAGLTTYSPLKRLGAGPGKKVAVCGLGGLGHFAVLWSVALGAETYVISHSPKKKEDALKLGAKEFICTTDDSWTERWTYTFDMILNCATTDRLDLPSFFSTLKVHGTFHMVGLPDNPLPSVKVQAFALNGCSLSASNIGNRTEMIEMLEFAAKRNIKCWVDTVDIGEKGCKEAVERVHKGDGVRYRLVLTNYDAIFGQRS